MTPTQRTLAELRKLGYMAAVVEKWNPHARIRQDLFGIVDVVAIAPEPGEKGVDEDADVLWIENHVEDPTVDPEQPIGRAIGEMRPCARTLAVQATSGSNVAARITKLQASDALPRLLAAGWRVEVWGWRKSRRSSRWELRREVVTTETRA